MADLLPMPPAAHPTLAQSARSLVAASRHATLATLDPRQGHPYASVLEILPDPQGGVVFFISQLAAHTTNLRQDPRASLLMTDPLGAHAPLSHERITLMGQASPQEHGAWREAFVQAHPGASRYIDFKDFGFWRLEPQRARYIAGFGRMDWLTHDDYLAAHPDPTAAHRHGILRHMSEDHEANLLDYARAWAGVEWAERARMVGLDHLGFDLELTGDHDDSGRRVRLMFPQPLTEAKQARGQLVRMAHQAREFLGPKARAKAPGAHPNG